MARRDVVPGLCYEASCGAYRRSAYSVSGWSEQDLELGLAERLVQVALVVVHTGGTAPVAVLEVEALLEEPVDMVPSDKMVQPVAGLLDHAEA